jgi:hypothetical protein
MRSKSQAGSRNLYLANVADPAPINDEWRLEIDAGGAEGEVVEKLAADTAAGAAEREEAIADERAEVEGSGRVAWEERPPNPFAIFGGLGV